MTSGPTANGGFVGFFSWAKASREKRLFLIFISALILVLAVPWPGLFFSLHVQKGRSGPVLLTLPFIFRHTFFLSYTHSIYLAPVVEKLEADGSAIHLREISTKSRGAIESYNFRGTLHQERGEIRMRDIDFTVPELPVIIGHTGTQRLIWEDRVFSLYELSAPGGVLTIKPVKISLWRYAWEGAFRSRKAG
jgi:hypothetical protein